MYYFLLLKLKFMFWLKSQILTRIVYFHQFLSVIYVLFGNSLVYILITSYNYIM